MVQQGLPHEELLDRLWNLRAVEASLDAEQRLRRGWLLRSEAPYHLRPTRRAELLAKLQVRRLIDLRTDVERCAAFDPIDGIVVESYPLPDVSRDPDLLDGTRSLEDAYVAMLDEHGPTVARAVAALAGDGPVLVHCTAGKDRTGIVIALALDLLGVERDTIVSDYAASGANLARLTEGFRRARVEPPWSSLPPAVQASPPGAIEQALAHVRDGWGSTRSFLLAHGVAPASLTALVADLVEEATGSSAEAS